MSQVKNPRQDIPPPFISEGAVADRLVHLIPDELANRVPDHPLFAFPKTKLCQDGFVEVTAKDFANAINRTSWYLESILGKSPGGFPSIAYMGSSDLRYFLFMFGAIKAGYKMLYLSPRNSVAGHINVLEKADCHTFLVAKNTNIEHILSERNMVKVIVPELDELLDETPVPVYPYNKTFAEARKDPCLVLHTTGSTGLPKPITWKLEILSTYEAWRTIPAIDGYLPTTEVYQQARRVYNAMPLFHTSGLNIGITMSLVLGVTTVFGAANVIPHAAYADEIHKYAGVDASVGPPSIYEELCQDPTSFDAIKNLHYILVCGAPLAQSAGDIISEHTRVISNFGATETACLPRLAPGIEDWAYFYWHPSHSGIELREYMDGLYELFLVRDQKLDLYQGIFSTFPHLEEYSMNDLYSKHPDPAKGFLYKWRGRADDVIVLSNGEKLAPALMEASLRSSPLVKGAMVVGRGKFQPAALVDLGEAAPDNARDRHALAKELLPAIDEANKHAPAHGKLDQYHILFVDPSRPIHYLGQGKIQRHKTYQLYHEDIEALYKAAENLDDQLDLTFEDVGHLRLVDFNDREDIKTWLGELVAKISNVHDLEGDAELFAAGLDSLHVLRLIRELKLHARFISGGLTPKLLSPSIVYANPSLNELSNFIWKQAGSIPKERIDIDDIDSAYQSDEKSADHELDYMESLLEKYVQNLPVKNRVRQSTPAEGMTVLLTGSTGSLGSYILSELINDPNVARIICLDRTSHAAEKYKQNGPKRGLTALDSGRVEFLAAKLSDSHLGLGEEAYERVANTVTHIIHCQWPVNFNWTLPSFQPYIKGVLNMAKLANVSTQNAFVLFVSSIAAVGGWKGPGKVPESPIRDLSASAGTGYGQSKLIAERLLDKAVRISGVRSAVCRVGIVAGPVEQELGMWNKHEYIPSVIVSSAHLGVFPETFPSRDHIDWVPVDKLSKILVEILASASKPSTSLKDFDEGLPDEIVAINTTGTKVYHVVNPQVTSWSHDLSADLLALFPSGTVKPVPFEEWLSKLKSSAEEMEKNGHVDVERNPAIRLIDFYTEALAGAGKIRRTLPSAASEKASKTLRELGPLKRDWVENWMVQWGIKLD